MTIEISYGARFIVVEGQYKQIWSLDQIGGMPWMQIELLLEIPENIVWAVGVFLWGGGGGERIRFWEDAWVGYISLAERFPLLYRVPNFWFICFWGSFEGLRLFIEFKRFRRRLNDGELEQASEIIMMLDPIHICDAVVDRRTWKLEDSGIFSCKSIFK